MLRLVIMAGVLAGMIGTLGCDHGQDPPPPVNVSFEAGGRMMVPLPVPSRAHDRGIVGAAATAEEAAAPTSPAGTAGAVAIDHSSPETVIAAYIEIMRTGSIQQLPDVVVPEQQEARRQLSEAKEPLVQALQTLVQRCREHFPDADLPNTAMPGFGSGVDVTLLSVEPVSDDQAVASVQVPGMPMASQIGIRRVGDGWRIVDPEVQTLEQAGLADKLISLVPRMIESVQSVTSRIDAGEITSAEDAGRVLETEMQQLEAQLQQGFGELSSLNPERPPDADTAPPLDERPREQPREEVDDVYSGPGQLRAR